MADDPDKKRTLIQRCKIAQGIGVLMVVIGFTWIMFLVGKSNINMAHGWSAVAMFVLGFPVYGVGRALIWWHGK